MAEHAWLALLSAEVIAGAGGVSASGDAPLSRSATARYVDGEPAGRLVTWRHDRRPHAEALRVSPDIVADPRRAVSGAHGAGPGVGAVDVAGPWAVSLVVVPRGRRPLFDDPAVVAAARDVMRDPGRVAAVSTLVIDAVHWAGSVCAVAADVAQRWPAWWSSDPYGRLAPATRLIVDAGVLLAAPLPVGPGTQRYAGSPWPAGSFAG